MSRAPARFTQADIARAIRAVKQEGLHAAVKADKDGTIWIVPIKADTLETPCIDEDKEIRL